MNRLPRVIGLLSMIAALAAVPAAAHAQDNSPTGGSGGCHHTDSDGYDIPIDEGQTVFVDGQLVTCSGGRIIITRAPDTSSGSTTTPGNIKPGTVKAGTIKAGTIKLATKNPAKRIVTTTKAKTKTVAAKR